VRLRQEGHPELVLQRSNKVLQQNMLRVVDSHATSNQTISVKNKKKKD